MFNFTSLDFCLRGHVNALVYPKHIKKKEFCTFGGSFHLRPQRITSNNILCSIAEWTPDLYFRVNHTAHKLNEFSQYKQFSAFYPVVPDSRDAV